MEGGSYRLREHYADAEAEVERLRAQATVHWQSEADALVRRGLAPDDDVLEAGCGPGFVTELLLDLVAAGTVTATDVDPEMVARTTARLGDRDRLSVVEASATALPFADGSFDAVTARLLLQHLPAPEKAIAEFARVLKPAGRIFVTDVDDGLRLLVDPEPPFVDEVGRAIERAQEARGGNRRIGRRLPRLLREAGFTEIAVDGLVAHSEVVGLEALRGVLSMGALRQLAEAGILARETFDAAVAFDRAITSGEIELQAMLTVLLVSARLGSEAERRVP